MNIKVNPKSHLIKFIEGTSECLYDYTNMTWSGDASFIATAKAYVTNNIASITLHNADVGAVLQKFINNESKYNVSDKIAELVTLGTTQEITGAKNFRGPVTYTGVINNNTSGVLEINGDHLIPTQDILGVIGDVNKRFSIIYTNSLSSTSITNSGNLITPIIKHPTGTYGLNVPFDDGTWTGNRTLITIEDVPTDLSLYDNTSSNFITINDVPVQEQADWAENDTSKKAYINNKPTKLSQFSNDSSFITLSQVPQSNWNENSDQSKAFIKNKPTNLSQFNNDTNFITAQDVPAQIQPDWEAASGLGEILHKPTNVSDFTNDAGYITANDVPAQIQPDWEAASGLGEILHKPTALSDFTNDSGFITANDVPAQVKANWNEADTTAAGYIQNKPTALSDFTNDVITISNGEISINGVVVLTYGASGEGKLAQIGSNGKLSESIIPDSIAGQMVYGGTFNAATKLASISKGAVAKIKSNIPTFDPETDLQTDPNTGDIIYEMTFTNTNAFTGPAGNEGIYYINKTVSNDFFGLTIKVGDWLVSDGTGWSVIENTDAVTGVKGAAEQDYRIGNINISPANIGITISGNSITVGNDTLTIPTVPTNVSDFTNDAGYITAQDVPTQVQPDWEATSGLGEILHKPTIPTVPTNVSDFTNDAGYITTNDIPAQVKANWNETDTTAAGYIQNKPTSLSQFTNDAGFITAANVTGQVQADWNETDTTSPAYINNKPQVLGSQTQSDWSETDTTAAGYIQNKPTNVSDFTNDAGYGRGTVTSVTTGNNSGLILETPANSNTTPVITVDSNYKLPTNTEWNGKVSQIIVNGTTYNITSGTQGVINLGTISGGASSNGLCYEEIVEE